MSYPTIKYLFGEEKGWGDHAAVHAVQVDPSTPLGPTNAAPPPTKDAGASADASSGGPSCKADGDCNLGSDGSGEICVNGACVAGCNANWECPGSTTCVGGECR